jgi:hypothetical protein
LLRARVSASAMRRLCGFDAPAVTLLELPIVTDSGEVIERHFGWGRSADASGLVDGTPPMELVRRASALSGRLRRRTRVDRASSPLRSSSPTQAGLFDARGVSGVQSAPATVASVEAVTSESVHVGRPVTVLTLERRT